MFQPNYTPKSKPASPPADDFLTNCGVEPFAFSQDNSSKTVIDSWKEEQAQRQNQRKTLLEVEEDQPVLINQNSPENKPGNSTMNYKLIGINKIDQLNYFPRLIAPQLPQRWQNYHQVIKLRGILAETKQQKIGLILANIAANNRVAEIISLHILPNYPQYQIGTKLIQCLRTSLPKINCDRLAFDPYTKAISTQMGLFI